MSGSDGRKSVRFDQLFKQQTHRRILAAPSAPELCSVSRPRNDRGRKEGRVQAAPMVRVQQKARGRTTGMAEHPAFPARWAYGLYVISPGTGSLPPSLTMPIREHRNLDLSTGRPGPHDFTVRVDAVRRRANARCNPTRPPHPTSRIVTIARTPLCDEAGRGNEISNSEKWKEQFLGTAMISVLSN
jgi:hypothetical protein